MLAQVKADNHHQLTIRLIPVHNKVQKISVLR